jgi:hypothetical protein
MQDYWTDKGEPKMSYETYCCEVKQALHSFYEIQASVRKQLGDNRTDERDFIVYPIDYMLTSGLDIMDFGPSDSVAYVRFYPLASRQVGEDCPILRLEKKYHPQWFQFYKEQFALHESLANEQVAQGLFSHSLDQKEAPLDRSSRPSRSRSRRGRRSAKKRAAKSRH